MRNILLVEDDKDIQEVNKNMLERRGGYRVRLAMTLIEAKEIVIESAPDIIILDIMLPDGSGLDFLRELRQDQDIPVLLLTALVTPNDVVDGLAAGGDDYLAKPYDNNVLLARIESLLRRSERVLEKLIKGSLTLDLIANRALLDGIDLSLTGMEFAVLRLLAQNEGKIISAAYIYEKVWACPLNGDKNAIQTVISKIRKKIEFSGYDIDVLRMQGYTFRRN